MRGFWRSLTSDRQLRWLGPEKGVIHLATAAVVNAVWDLWAKRERQAAVEAARRSARPSSSSRRSTSATSTDALSPDEALRVAATTTRAGSEEPRGRDRRVRLSGVHDLRRLARATTTRRSTASSAKRVAAGFTHVKMKVGRGHRVGSTAGGARSGESLGPRRRADDGRQPGLGRRRGHRRDAACSARTTPGGSRSRRAPTTSSATRGSAARSPRSASRRASTFRTGSSSSSSSRPRRSTFASSTPAASAASTRRSPMLLLAAKFGIPVCPHAGGVGLCEYVQHLAIFDYIAVSGSLENRVVEWVDHLHEHFRDPAVVARRPLPGATAPGYSIEMLPDVARRVRVPARPRLGEGSSAGGLAGDDTSGSKLRAGVDAVARPLPPAAAWAVHAQGLDREARWQRH